MLAAAVLSPVPEPSRYIFSVTDAPGVAVILFFTYWLGVSSPCTVDRDSLARTVEPLRACTLV